MDNECVQALVILTGGNEFFLEIDHPLKTHASRRSNDEHETNLIRVGIEILPKLVQLTGEINVPELSWWVLSETASREPAHW